MAKGGPTKSVSAEQNAIARRAARLRKKRNAGKNGLKTQDFGDRPMSLAQLHRVAQERETIKQNNIRQFNDLANQIDTLGSVLVQDTPSRVIQMLKNHYTGTSVRWTTTDDGVVFAKARR